MTEEKPDTEAPDDVIVEVPRPVAVGDIVIKTESPQIYDGLVLATGPDLTAGEVAYLVGRRDEGGPWVLIRATVASLVRRDLAGDTPGYVEIGTALLAAHEADRVLADARAADLVTARARELEVTNRLTTREDRVRQQIIDTGNSYSWDDDEVNELLRNLDLDPMEQEYSINVDVTATQSVYVTVTATSLDAAIDLVEGDSDYVAGAVSSYDWSMSDEYEVDRYNSGLAD